MTFQFPLYCSFWISSFLKKITLGFCCHAWAFSSWGEQWLFFFFFSCWRVFIYLFIYFLFFFFICSEFCHTLEWNSHGFTCVPHPDPPSHLPLHPLPQWLFFTVVYRLLNVVHRLLLLQSTDSRHTGFSSCGWQSLEHGLSGCGSPA